MISTMKRLTTVFTAALAALIALGTAVQAQDAPSTRFMPDKVYTTTLVQTITGNDGTKDITPVTRSQVYRVETGKMKNNSFPATLTVYSGASGTEAETTNPETVIKFQVSGNTLTGFELAKGEGRASSDAAHIMAGQHLEGMLQMTKYDLKRKIKREYTIESNTGSGTTRSVSFKIQDISPDPMKDVGMITRKYGKGTFDTRYDFFTQVTETEENNIFVPADELGPEKEVTMKTVRKYTTKIANN
ncbi:MAG: hypothetical protein CL946_11145 [Ectothiorhodospiraceae bacterium]|nr:hypothetical protein [Ectothiorhodospiraceae bacterium]